MAGRGPVPRQDTNLQHVRERAARAPRRLRGENAGVLGIHIGHSLVHLVRNYALAAA